MRPEHLILSPLPFPPQRTSPRRVERPGLSLRSFFFSGHELQLLSLPSGPGQALPTPGLPDSVPQDCRPHRTVWALSLGPGCYPASQAHQLLGLPGSCLVSCTSPASRPLLWSSQCPLAHIIPGTHHFWLCVRAMQVLPFPQHCLSGSVALPAALGSDCGKPGINPVLP